MKKNDIAGLVFLTLMIGGLAAMFLFAPQAPEVEFAPVEVEGSALVLVDAGEGGVVVDAVMGARGFITLHERIGDAPGPIIGVSEVLDVGMHSALTISSTQMLSPDSAYVLLMTADDGDRVYEAGIDRPVMVNGQTIRVPVLL